ncbi:short-chain collagen C4-like [Dreissena polymorpha]|uniref:short-chain collagen C4-like n=1 Tax=Dreissena polymorpha TaxID=45954 RepID=UPI002264EBDB|nr:short-chain collagen C4-like [Dreissena polymorpha]
MQQKTITTLLKTEKSGSTFTRWGRNVCPDSTAPVYKGYIAGKKYNEAGSGSDTICLPDEPTWANYTDGNQDALRGRIYGTEIDINEPSKIFPYNVWEQDVPCVVCLSDKSSVLMFPARANCYKGWSLQYSGYIMANSHVHAGPHNHICVDFQPEFVPNGARNDDQHILYLIEAQCGSLPCPPYVQGRELSCVVCSKNDD